MNVHGSGTGSVLVGGIACVCLIVAACNQGPHEQLTSKRPYADLIGSEYQVVADDLYAYGIYASRADKTVSWVTLIPGIGIAGSEVAFRRHVPKGHIIRILSAWRQLILLGNGVYYLVAVKGSDLPRDLPIRLELFGGNEGVGADLNPSIYTKLPRNN